MAISSLNLPSKKELFQHSAGKRLRICMVASVDVLDPISTIMGGLETAMCNIASLLAAGGHEVALVGNMASGPVTHNGVSYLPIQDWKAGVYPDYLHAIDVLAFASGPDLGSYEFVNESAVKIVLFHHRKLAYMMNCNAFTLLNFRVNAISCVSRTVKRNLIKEGVNPAKLTVIPNGVDHSVFYLRPVEREPQRIIFVGALVKYKNPHLLIEAFTRITSKFLKAELHFFGDASLWGSKEYIDSCDVSRRFPQIIFHGKINKEQLAIEYSRASICVIPSKYESFSLVSVEAQACGCVPVIATIGGITETIIPGKSGFICKSNDVDSLAKTLEHLFLNPETIRQSSQYAIKHVTKTYSWKSTVVLYERLFYALIKNKISSKSENDKNSKTWIKKFIKNKYISKKLLIETYIALGEMNKKTGIKGYRLFNRKALNILLKIRNASSNYKYKIASRFKQNSDFDEAAIIFEKLLKSKKKDIKSGAFFHLGEIALFKNNLQLTTKYFKKCLQINSDHKKAEIYLEQLSKRQQQS